MDSEIIYRPIRADECPAIVCLHRISFPSEEVQRTIYSAPGINRYLANLIRYSGGSGANQLWGGWQGDQLVGYAHFIASTASWHLNYIATRPDCRKQGIAQRLWEIWLKKGREREYKRFSLDVACENQGAYAWYSRQGFRVANTTYVYEKTFPASPFTSDSAIEFYIKDWETAEAWQAMYGFSQFELNVESNSWRIGRIGTWYYQAQEVLPPAAERIMEKMDGGRNLLIRSETLITDPQSRQVAVSYRMSRGLE